MVCLGLFISRAFSFTLVSYNELEKRGQTIRLHTSDTFVISLQVAPTVKINSSKYCNSLNYFETKFEKYIKHTMTSLITWLNYHDLNLFFYATHTASLGCHGNAVCQSRALQWRIRLNKRSRRDDPTMTPRGDYHELQCTNCVRWDRP